MQGVMGLLVLLLVAWAFSEDRRRLPVRTVLVGLTLQLGLALALTRSAWLQGLFAGLNRLALVLDQATRAGTTMVFGFLGGGPLPYLETAPGASFVLAFRALPLILVISALSALLFHWRILPWLVRGFSFLLQRSLRIGGALGVGAAANVFVGMVEAPLLVRPYLASMSRSELFALMTCGMSTVAGTVLVLYANILQQTIPSALGHILTASIISAPAALVVAAVMVPPTAAPTTAAQLHLGESHGAMDALVRGTTEGVKLLLNVVAMLLVLVALVSLVNLGLEALPPVAGAPLSLQRLLGWGMAPVAWLIGIPWAEAQVAGSLLGTKTVLNEFLAYLDLAALPEAALAPRSRLIITYALCGFANFGSLGIMLGGLGSMAPERRSEFVELGFRSILAGTLATCMTGAVIGLIS